jgi:hypothetical protein
MTLAGLACGPFPTPGAVFTTPVSPSRLERPPRNFGSHSGSLEAQSGVPHRGQAKAPTAFSLDGALPTAQHSPRPKGFEP